MQHANTDYPKTALEQALGERQLLPKNVALM